MLVYCSYNSLLRNRIGLGIMIIQKGGQVSNGASFKSPVARFYWIVLRLQCSCFAKLRVRFKPGSELWMVFSFECQVFFLGGFAGVLGLRDKELLGMWYKHDLK